MRTQYIGIMYIRMGWKESGKIADITISVSNSVHYFASFFYCFESNSIVKWWKQKAFLSWKTVIFRSVWFDMIMKMLVLWVVLLMRDCRWNNKTKKVLFYSIALHGIWKIMIMKQWHILPFSSWFCWFGSFSLTHTLVSSSQFWMFCHESCDNIIIRIDNYLYRHEKWILLLTA